MNEIHECFQFPAMLDNIVCCVCRLIPLAISCIYEATLSHNRNLQQINQTKATAQDLGQRQLALQLGNALAMLGLDQDVANSPGGFSMRPVVNFIKLDIKDEEAPAVIRQMQLAWQSAFDQYDSCQSGNCLFWLFEEPVSQNMQTSWSSGDLHQCEEQQQWQMSQGGQYPAAAVEGHMSSEPMLGDTTMQAGNALQGYSNHTTSVSNSASQGQAASNDEASRFARRGKSWLHKAAVLVAVAAFATNTVVILHDCGWQVGERWVQSVNASEKAFDHHHNFEKLGNSIERAIKHFVDRLFDDV